MLDCAETDDDKWSSSSSQYYHHHHDGADSWKLELVRLRRNWLRSMISMNMMVTLKPLQWWLGWWLFRRIGYKGELISHSLAHLLSQSRPDKVLKFQMIMMMLSRLMMILMIMNDDRTFWLWWCWLGFKLKSQSEESTKLKYHAHIQEKHWVKAYIKKKPPCEIWCVKSNENYMGHPNGLSGDYGTASMFCHFNSKLNLPSLPSSFKSPPVLQRTGNPRVKFETRPNIGED